MFYTRKKRVEIEEGTQTTEQAYRRGAGVFADHKLS
jgi:hypothetical protein